jgi:UDP-N-acetyl-D-glucosamine dehydrogenase
MPRHVVAMIMEALNERDRCLRGAGVLMLGVTYKRDVSDVRESPALEIMKMLREKGARVNYSDPYAPQVLVEDDKISSMPLTPQVLAAHDCVVITTDHSTFDYDMIVREASLIIDVRNALGKERDHRGKIVTL